jgi:LysM repeat protein
MSSKSRITLLVIAAYVLALAWLPVAVQAAANAQSATYVVRSGDTLSGIASRFGSSVQAIMSANGLADSVIYPGQSLAIPSGGGATAPQSTGSGSRGAGAAGGGSHTVRAGESLWSIASSYGVSVAALQAANGLSGNVIIPGQTLAIPRARAAMPLAAAAASAGSSERTSASGACGGSYVVRPGEVLSTIAARCGLSVAELMAANRLSGTTVYRGQTLTIPAAGATASRSAPAAPRSSAASLPTPVPPFPAPAY